LTLSNNDSTSLTLQGTQAIVNTALASLRYTADAAYTGADAVVVLVNDQGHSGADPDSVAVIAAIPGIVGNGNAAYESKTATLAITVTASGPATPVVANTDTLL
ncbi:hypothetical protein JZU54_01745, partial [bacterium]|nr:hypothetical protein [bacterium]